MFLNSISKIANSFQKQQSIYNTPQIQYSIPNSRQRPKIEQGSLENGQVTQFYFKKLIELQLALSLIIVINLYLNVVAVNQSFYQTQQSNSNDQIIFLYLSMLCVALATFILIMRTHTVLKLQKQQKIIYQQATLISTKKIIYLCIECLVVLVQPYSFFKDITFYTENAYADYQIYYPVNDLLAILSFARIYILFRTALLFTPYMNNRSNRLCKMYGCKADISFSLKCMFKDNPLTLICIFFTSSALIFAYLIYLAQRQLAIQGNNTFQFGTCNNYQNSLWLILMTATTVGYGDYYPKTPLGRIIILFVAIWGTLIVSIMVVVVSNTLNMQKSQVRTSKILHKLQLRQDIKKKSARFIGYFVYAVLKKGLHYQQQQQAYTKVKKAQSQFNQIKKQLKDITEYEDIQDQIAAHFLKLNSDIDILNNNQDKIIQFIHQNFNYKPQNDKQQSNRLQTFASPKQEDEQAEQEDVEFMEMFRAKYKQQ